MRKIQLGSVSTATLRPEDLIPALADELDGIRSESFLLSDAERFFGVPEDEAPDWDSEEAGCLLDDLFTALNEYAPPHMYFGAHEGDGADFGWWQTGFEDCHKVWVDQGKNGQGSFVDTECRLYVEVNDHGNMTVMKLGGEVIWDCV